MNWYFVAEPLQLVAWLIALVEIIVALYVLALNVRQVANRYVSALLLLFAVETLAVGQLIGAPTLTQAQAPTFVLAIVVPALNVWLLLTTLWLLKPDWMRRWRALRVLLHLLLLIPLALTLVDSFYETGIWYTGLAPATYTGGYVQAGEYLRGAYAVPLRILILSVIPVATILPLVYLAFFDHTLEKLTRQLVWLLLTVQVLAAILQMGMRGLLLPAVIPLITSVLFAVAYIYADFREMITTRQVQGGRLQTRLTLLTLSIVLPTLIAVSVFVSNQASQLIREFSIEQLSSASQALETNVMIWLEYNVKALEQFVNHPATIEMDTAQQVVLLRTLVETYPDVYFASTSNVDGLNVARSDGAPPVNFNNRTWFQFARLGTPLVFETDIDPVTGNLSLVISKPIYNADGEIVGVAMVMTDVTALREQLRLFELGDTGLAYVIDKHDIVVAHSDPQLEIERLDLSPYAPVSAMRRGARGQFDFVDEDGVSWLAYVKVIDNNWGVMVQQQQTEWAQAQVQFQRGALVVLGGGLALLLTLILLTLRQALRPIATLTETAQAVAAGNLQREAPIESGDELGVLAETFNSMTAQLRELIAGLEQNVEERTRDLERRTQYMIASAEVARAISSILDLQQLLSQVVELIRERFDLYYVGLFLVDEEREWAVLRAGTGEAGVRMLARGHRIRVGEGMIGWSVANAQARVAAEVREDEVRQVTAELPETRAEAALPLRSRGRVLGALTVQSDQPGVFDTDTVTVLQTMADQVAVAIDNAELFLNSQRALETAQRAYGQFTRQSWLDLLREQAIVGYRYLGRSLLPAEGDWRPEMLSAAREGELVVADEGRTVVLPIKVRGEQVAGVLRFSKEDPEAVWTEAELALLNALVAQLSVAMESAQLFHQTQRRAVREQVVGQINARVRAEVEVEALLERALEELGRVLDARRASVQLEVGEA